MIGLSLLRPRVGVPSTWVFRRYVRKAMPLEDDKKYDPKEIEPALREVVEKARIDWSHYSTGKTSPSVLNHISVTYRGQLHPLQTLAQITLKDPMTLLVMVSNEDQVKPVITAIQKSPLNLNPISENSTTLKVPVSRPSQESRILMGKQIMMDAEKRKIEIRHIRQKELQAIKKNSQTSDEKRRWEKELQKCIDGGCEQIDRMAKLKVKEITGSAS